MDFSELRTAIRDEIGIDAHALYKDERYSIPPYLLDLLNDAIIVAFLTGFFGLDELGKAARNRIIQFMETFRKGPQLVTLNIGSDVDHALQLSNSPDPQGRQRGHDNLIRLLIDYGMSEEIAKAHAALIEESIVATLVAKKG